MLSPLETFRLWRTRRFRARPELARRLKLLFRDDLPFVLGGIHDWQLHHYEHPGMPPIDVLYGGLCFSFLPPSGLFGALLPARRLLEEAFRRRLRAGSDVVPVLPIFVSPAHVLRFRDDALLAAYLDDAWHSAVLWGLCQLPPSDADQKAPPVGTADSRRAYLEEASRSSFFAALLTHA